MQDPGRRARPKDLPGSCGTSQGAMPRRAPSAPQQGGQANACLMQPTSPLVTCRRRKCSPAEGGAPGPQLLPLLNNKPGPAPRCPATGADSRPGLAPARHLPRGHR